MPILPRLSCRFELAIALTVALLGPGTQLGCGGSAGAETPDRKGKGKRGGKHGGKGKGDRKGKGPGGGPTNEPLTVTITHVTPQALFRYYRTSGSLKAVRTAEIVAVQSGIIEQLGAEEGDLVEAGQLLAKLDARSFQLEASRDRITAENAKKQLARLEKIAAQDAVAREELDQQIFSLKTARANAKLSRHQVRQSVVRAPFTGTITQRHVDVGNLASSTSSLFSLADLTSLDLELHLPEAEAATVKLGSEVEVELLDGSTFQAAILRRAPIVDPLTGTVKFTVRSRSFPKIAVPGAFARARVLVDTRPAALSLPHSAVFDVEGKPHVYVVVDGKASRRPIEVGLRGEERVEVRGGLKPETEVVLDSSSGITEGLPIKAVAEKAEKAAPTEPPSDAAIVKPESEPESKPEPAKAKKPKRRGRKRRKP